MTDERPDEKGKRSNLCNNKLLNSASERQNNDTSRMDGTGIGNAIGETFRQLGGWCFGFDSETSPGRVIVAKTGVWEAGCTLRDASPEPAKHWDLLSALRPARHIQAARRQILTAYWSSQV